MKSAVSGRAPACILYLIPLKPEHQRMIELAIQSGAYHSCSLPPTRKSMPVCAARKEISSSRMRGAFRTTNAGEIMDLQTIVGGTGELAGASGILQAVGTFTSAAGGQSEYDGTI